MLTAYCTGASVTIGVCGNKNYSFTVASLSAVTPTLADANSSGTYSTTDGVTIAANT